MSDEPYMIRNGGIHGASGLEVLKVRAAGASRSVRYYVLVSQELLDADTPWESAGLHLIEQGGFTDPGFRWCLFEDDNAPAELNGLKIELTFERAGMRPVITDRQVIG